MGVFSIAGENRSPACSVVGISPKNTVLSALISFLGGTGCRRSTVSAKPFVVRHSFGLATAPGLPAPTIKKKESLSEDNLFGPSIFAKGMRTFGICRFLKFDSGEIRISAWTSLL